MKKAKNGVSLIVLIVTIIVVIILAAAVILTVQNQNPIFSARTAVEKEDYIEAQNAYNMWLSKVMVTQLDEVSFSGWFGIKMSGGKYDKNVKKISVDYYNYIKTHQLKEDIKLKKVPSEFNITAHKSTYMTDSRALLKKEVIDEYISQTDDTANLGLPKQVHSIFIHSDNFII